MKRQFLLVVVTPHLALAFVENLPDGKLTVNGIDYVDLGLGDWTGFYDWLREKSGQVCGVRYTPFPEFNHLLDRFPSDCSYLAFPSRGSKSYVEIFFTSSRDYEAEKSDDQEQLAGEAAGKTGGANGDGHS